MPDLPHLLRQHPEIALFFVIAAGFWAGRFKFRGFGLGVVTSTLLVGVLVGQLNIELPSHLKSVFFLLFLFAVGYGVGPQFFGGLKKDGLKQVIFAVFVTTACLLTACAMAWLMGYHPGLAAGLLAGASTISAVLGVASDTIGRLPIPAAEKDAFMAAMPVAYAVTYLFGTAGSAWILSALAPKLLRIDLAEECRRYEAEQGPVGRGPQGGSAYLRFVFRAHRLMDRFAGATVADLERELGPSFHLLRARRGDQLVELRPTTILDRDTVVAVAASREAFVKRADAFGAECDDRELLDIRAESMDVVVTNPAAIGLTLSALRDLAPLLHVRGVFVHAVERRGAGEQVGAHLVVQRGDVLQLLGPVEDIERAAAWLGHADRAGKSTNMVLMGLGIAGGALLGALSLQVGQMPLSLTMSGGVLIAGLVCGWLRSVRRTIGRIPEAALWVFNNVGLNAFIASVGLAAGPTFVSGLKESGLGLLAAGMVVTTVPFLVALPFGRHVLRMHPAILIGACAGARTTTAALGAIEEIAHSPVPALGYTVPYAVGNTLLTMAGSVVVLLTA